MCYNLTRLRVVLTIFLRGAPGKLLKHLIETVGVRITDLFADFGDVHLGGGKVNLRKLHAFLRQILPGGYADVFLEYAADVNLVVVDVSQRAL